MNIYIYASICVYNLNFESTTWFSSKAGHKGRNFFQPKAEHCMAGQVARCHSEVQMQLD